MLTEAQKQTSVEKVEFILNEIQRIGELLDNGKQPSEIFGDGPGALPDLAAHIKHRETQREYTCGRKALRMFSDLASLALENCANSQDFDPDEVSDRLRDTFLSFVYRHSKGSVLDFVEEWIDCATLYVKQRHRSYTHYLPCVALQIGAAESYRFGSVEFSRKGQIRAEIVNALEGYEAARSRLSNRVRRNSAPCSQWGWDRAEQRPPKEPAEAFDRLTEGVDWVAKITVPRCASSVSELRAEAALRVALCGITLLLQGTEGAGLRLRDDPFMPFRVNKLMRVGAGRKVRPSSSWRFGAPKVEEGWQEHIESRASEILSVLDHLMTQTLAGRSLSFGFQIALRAVTWYADAVRETNCETRLVKCTSAIECLLLPPKRQATAAFVIRGSLLAQRVGLPMSHWEPIAKRLYERRGDVVHGNVESLKTASQESSLEAMDFTRNVVLQFLVFCQWLQPLGPRRVGTRDEFLELYRHVEAGFHDDIMTIVKKYRFTWDVVPPRNP